MGPKAKITAERMLSRDDFTLEVLRRDKQKCVVCGGAGNQAHHILDRKLWPNRDGYYLANGATLCEADHWRCELTDISVEEVRALCKISEPAIPPGFNSGQLYDKWGNEVLADGRRKPGPLFNDDGAQKALRKGKHLWRFA